MKNFFITFVFGVLLLFIGIIWGYSNPEKVEILKNFFKEREKPIVNIESGNIVNIRANSFSVEISKVMSLSEKTAFIIYNENNSYFDKEKMRIYTQNGYLIKDLNLYKLKLPSAFTMARNGGIKTIFTYQQALSLFLLSCC